MSNVLSNLSLCREQMKYAREELLRGARDLRSLLEMPAGAERSHIMLMCDALEEYFLAERAAEEAARSI